MKTTIKVFILSTLSVSIFTGIGFAQHGRRGNYGSSPMQIFETVVDNANKGGYAIQETALDGITDLEGGYSREFKITNTLDYIRKNLDPYLQWAIYIGLVLATVALIYSGFLLVTHGIHKQGDWTKVKTNVMYVVIGVFLLTGFYFIIKVMVALITSLFGGSTGNSGF